MSSSYVWDCVVVGAGVGGIAAALNLLQSGFKVQPIKTVHTSHLTAHNLICDLQVLLIEARDRPGGRVHTDYEWADYPIELGAGKCSHTHVHATTQPHTRTGTRTRTRTRMYKYHTRTLYTFRIYPW